MRLSYEELNKVKEKFGVNMLWSFSRFDCYRTSKYEYFLKYVKRVPENNSVSPYCVLGGDCHDILEKLYTDDISYEDMADLFDDAWTTNIELAELKFDRSDSERNNSIKNKYYENMLLFYKNYNQLPYKMKNEQFVTIKIADDIVFQGYIDAVYYNPETEVYTILDYKTSTKYSGKEIEAHAAQLVLYAEALRQLGIPKDKIRIGWNFLKYNNVNCTQVNGNIKLRIIERREVGEKLQSAAKTWLNKLGYKNEAFDYLDMLAQNNDISVLPADVQEKFQIDDCYVYYDDIWDFYENLREEIIETIAEINERVEEYAITEDEHLFWDDEETCKTQSYYFNNLSGYNIPTLKPYKEYLDKINLKNEESSNKSNSDEYAEDDLSWLQELAM